MQNTVFINKIQKNGITVLAPISSHCAEPLREPSGVYNDISPLCKGCPYPRHGLFCRDKHGNCLKKDVAEIQRKERKPCGNTPKKNATEPPK